MGPGADEAVKKIYQVEATVLVILAAFTPQDTEERKEDGKLHKRRKKRVRVTATGSTPENGRKSNGCAVNKNAKVYNERRLLRYRDWFKQASTTFIIRDIPRAPPPKKRRMFTGHWPLEMLT